MKKLFCKLRNETHLDISAVSSSLSLAANSNKNNNIAISNDKTNHMLGRSLSSAFFNNMVQNSDIMLSSSLPASVPHSDGADNALTIDSQQLPPPERVIEPFIAGNATHLLYDLIIVLLKRYFHRG